MPIPGLKRACKERLWSVFSARGWRICSGALVPVEEVVELKQGQKSITERKFFPGYVLVEMEMNDESWHLVKTYSH